MTLSLENVRKVVGGETHIHDLSLSIDPGSFNVLLGLTSAGKTTTMRLMAGLDQPTSGRIVMNGRNVTGVPVRKRNVAMVYQQFINYPSMTVFDNIASPLKLARMSKKEIRERVEREAERLHIEHLLERMPQELSGGQQQRTAMARALVRDAELLLMDEPLVNLDYKLREELRDEMRDIFRQREAVVVYATTDPMEALSLGGNTAVLDQGRLVQYGATPDVYREPASVAVTQVFSDPPMNMLPSRLEGGQLHIGGADPVDLPLHLRELQPGDYQIGIRPAHLHVNSLSADSVAISGEIDVAEVAGSETFVHIHVGDAHCVAQEPGVHNFRMGTHVDVHVETRQLFAFGNDGGLIAAPAQQRAAA